MRFGSLYGPRSNYRNGLYKIVYDYLKTKKISYFGSNKTMREYIHIKDAARSCVDILDKKFVNKVVVITGRQKIYVKKLLSVFSKLMGYGQKIYFKNIENPHHYERSPFSFSPKFGIRYFSKKNIALKNGLKELIYVIKKENNL